MTMSGYLDSREFQKFVEDALGQTAIRVLLSGSSSLDNLTIGTMLYQSTEIGITASVTQTQGQGALTKMINQVSVVANIDDTVTLMSAVAGAMQLVINDGDNTMQIFPASGDNLGEGLNIPISLQAGGRVRFDAYDATHWVKAGDINVEVEVGSGGSVAVIEDVTSPTLAISALGKLFDKNVLLRTGDDITGTATSTNYGDKNAVTGGDVVLGAVNLKTNGITAGTGGLFLPAVPNAIATISFGIGIDKDTALGMQYDLDTTGVVGTEGAIRTYDSISIGAETVLYDIAIFNLTSLGTLTADHVQMMNDLNTLYDWTAFAGSGAGGILDTTDTWALIGTWMATEADREAFFAIVIPSHVSSMDSAKLESITNMGGNLAVLKNSRFSSLAGTTASGVMINIEDGLNVSNTVAGTSEGVYVDYAINPNTEYYLGFIMGVVTGESRIIIRSLDINGDIVATLSSPTVSGNYTFTSDSEIYSLRLQFYCTIGASALGSVNYTNIQLNQGSTANTYATPLDNGITFGSRSANQLPDGDAEYDGSKWAGVAIISTNLSIVAFASQDTITSFTPQNSGWHTFACRNLTSDAGTVSGILNGVTAGAIAGNASPAWSVDKVELVAGTAYDFEVRGSADDIQFDAMIIEGEYTQAEIDTRDYVAYKPLELLTCPNNAGTSTVSDELISINGVPNILHNVTDNRTDSGDPELDTTLVAPPGDLMASDGTANFTDENGALTFDTDHYVYTVTTGASKAGFLDEGTFVVDRKYIVSVLAKDGTGAGASFRVNQLTNAGAVITNGATVVATAAYGQAFVEFIATETNNKIEVEIIAASVADGETVLFDDLLAYVYNIQENLAPNLEDISAFCSGSLIQETTEGQNHIVSVNGLMLSVVHYQGVQGAIDGTREGLLSKLNRSEQRLTYEFKVPSTGGVAANSNTWVPFSDIATMPDLVSSIKTLEETMDTNIDSVDYYDNGIVINADATGTGADDVLVHALVISGVPLIIHTIA